ncbi:MarR family winged helix-turn-helix transcriptional regulator [Microbacterium gorillae]|uniref:MarR family winged helix-turn-helix transcriptional regulator n=1 Tax=Microbacterium gorillae TaxID=1231063 RepID=UPI000693873F|nr:MarR family transcriptional regulator [Microbacterium gorillae]
MDIAEQITTAVRAVSFAQRDLMMEAIGETDLTPQQAMSLGYIEANHERGVIAKDLAAVSHTTPASVASLLQGLEDRGLITRAPSPTDSRVKLITPTAAGFRVVAGFDEKMAAAQKRLYSSLSETEQSELLGLLNRLVPEKYRDFDRTATPDRRPL